MLMSHHVIDFMQHLRKDFSQMKEPNEWWLDEYLLFTNCYFSCSEKRKIQICLLVV